MWSNSFPSIFLYSCGLILFHLSLDLFVKLSFSIYLSLSTSGLILFLLSIFLLVDQSFSICLSIYLCINTFSSIHRSICAFIQFFHCYICGLILFIYSAIFLSIYSIEPLIYLWINPFSSIHRSICGFIPMVH